MLPAAAHQPSRRRQAVLPLPFSWGCLTSWTRPCQTSMRWIWRSDGASTSSCSGACRHRHRHPKVSPLSRSNLLGLMWKICSPCCLACICLCASSDSNWWCPVVSLDLDDISVLSHLLPENWFAGRVFVCLCRILDKSRPTLSQSILGCIVSRNFWCWPYF
jgi:hypothetical protein